MRNKYQIPIHNHHAFITKIILWHWAEEKQQEHHLWQSFSSEYETLLTKYKINFDQQYVFHDPEDDSI